MAPTDTKTTRGMNLGSIAAYAMRGGKAHYVTDPPAAMSQNPASNDAAKWDMDAVGRLLAMPGLTADTVRRIRHDLGLTQPSAEQLELGVTGNE